jgi:hypothetical protein
MIPAREAGASALTLLLAFTFLRVNRAFAPAPKAADKIPSVGREAGRV